MVERLKTPSTLSTSRGSSVAQQSLAPALPVAVQRPVPPVRGSCVQLAQCSGVELLERIPAELIIKALDLDLLDLTWDLLIFSMTFFCDIH
jgi:hypothetical protein